MLLGVPVAHTDNNVSAGHLRTTGSSPMVSDRTCESARVDFWLPLPESLIGEVGQYGTQFTDGACLSGFIAALLEFVQCQPPGSDMRLQRFDDLLPIDIRGTLTVGDRCLANRLGWARWRGETMLCSGCKQPPSSPHATSDK